MAEGSDYKLTKSDVCTHCSQATLDALENKFEKKDLKTAEKAGLFVRLEKTYFSFESTEIKGHSGPVQVKGHSGPIVIPGA